MEQPVQAGGRGGGCSVEECQDRDCGQGRGGQLLAEEGVEAGVEVARQGLLGAEA